MPNETSSESDADLSDDISEPEISGFIDIKNWAAAGILAVAAIVGATNGFDVLWHFPIGNDEIPTRVAAIFLFITLAVLDVRWVIVTQHQLNMWRKWLNHPLAPAETYSALCGLSVALGVLPMFAHRIVVMSLIMTVYFGINIWTQWLSDRHFERALAKTRRRPQSPLRDQIHRAMEEFWVRRPQIPRICFMMLVSAVAVFFAVAGYNGTNRQQMRYYLLAYIVLLADIVISEIVIGRWRIKLDGDIEAAIAAARKKRD